MYRVPLATYRKVLEKDEPAGSADPTLAAR